MQLWGIGALIVIALTNTIPWEWTLLQMGYWEYGPGVVSATVGPIPVSELSFIVLQTVLVGLWVLFVDPQVEPARGTARGHSAGGLLGTAVA
ncbi:MAG: lycopene cyclase domain-containing protein, partial [Halodesulfurarchaeum sp.]